MSKELVNFRDLPERSCFSYLGLTYLKIPATLAKERFKVEYLVNAVVLKGKCAGDLVRFTNHKVLPMRIVLLKSEDETNAE